MKILIKELQKDTLTGSFEICGKVTYVDIGNKNISIKGKNIVIDFLLHSLVDDGSGTCNCFTWSDGHHPKFGALLGRHVIVNGYKSFFFREIGIDIKDICKLLLVK